MAEHPFSKREQELVNICFACALHAADYHAGQSHEQVAAWVAEQLKGCGFPTEPRGISWGVLVPEEKVV